MKSGSSSELHCGDVLRTRICFVGQLALFLEEDPVAHFVILPNFEEDETVLRDNLENLGCYPSAEKHMRMVSLEKSWPLSFGRETHSHGVGDGPSRGGNATCHPPRIAEEFDCASPNTQWAFPTALEEIWRGTS